MSQFLLISHPITKQRNQSQPAKYQMILNENLRDELATALKEFKSVPAVKNAAKVPNGNVHEYEKTLTEEDTLAMFRAIKRLMRIPLLKEFIMTRVASAYILKREYRHTFGNAYVWLIKELCSGLSSASKGKLSARTRKELAAWINNNTRSAGLQRDTIEELITTPDIRPDKPTLLYRGLLFQQRQFDENFGSVPYRKALEFVKTIKSGRDNLEMEYPLSSSWTTSRSIAERFATKRAATSEYGAMMSWINDAKNKSQISGVLGLVISTLAQPRDIIIDLNKVDVMMMGQHGNEAEMILAGGKYRVRIVSILTPQGEVDLATYQAHLLNQDTN